MEPRERGRHCRECDTLVLDSALHTRAEFLELLGRGDKVCAQLRPDGAGRVRFADSPLKRRLSVVALSAAMAACGEDRGESPPEVVGEAELRVDPVDETIVGEVTVDWPAPTPDPGSVEPSVRDDPSASSAVVAPDPAAAGTAGGTPPTGRSEADGEPERPAPRVGRMRPSHHADPDDDGPVGLVDL